MSHLSACPCCGIKLGASSLRTHISICPHSPSRESSHSSRNISVGTEQHNINSTLGIPYKIDISPCAETLIPSRSPSHKVNPPVLRLDLRSLGNDKCLKKDNNNDDEGVIVQDLWPYSESNNNNNKKNNKNKTKQHSRVGRSLSTLPSPPHAPPISRDSDSEQGWKIEDSVESAILSVPKEINMKKEKKLNSDDLIVGDNISSDYTKTFADPQLVGKIFQLEAANKELRNALIIERNAREESENTLKHILESMQTQISNLHTLMTGATKSADAAHYGVKNIEKKLVNIPTQEDYEKLQHNVEELLLNTYSSVLNTQKETPRSVIEKITLRGTSAESLSNITKDTYRSTSKEYVEMRQQQNQRNNNVTLETPFLHRNTAETVAQLLNSKPVAFLRTLSNDTSPTMTFTNSNTNGSINVLRKS